MSWAGKIFSGLVHKETKLQTPDFGTVCICYSKVSKIFVFLFLREKVRKINYFAQEGYIQLFNMYNVTENLFQINLTYYWSKNIELEGGRGLYLSLSLCMSSRHFELYLCVFSLFCFSLVSPILAYSSFHFIQPIFFFLWLGKAFGLCCFLIPAFIVFVLICECMWSTGLLNTAVI